MDQHRRQKTILSEVIPFLDITINRNTADETGTNATGTDEHNADDHADEKKKADPNSATIMI